MYVITHDGHPATLKKIYQVENKTNTNHIEPRSYLTAPTEHECKHLFLHHVGFTWRERAAGIDCKRVTVAA